MNQDGINTLAADLLATLESTSHLTYDQDEFGTEAECGTVCCMAGLCLIRKVGRAASSGVISVFWGSASSLEAGVEQLGLVTNVLSPIIFSGASNWPKDLSRRYYAAANSRLERVNVALDALARLNEDGSIRELSVDKESTGVTERSIKKESSIPTESELITQ